MSLIRAFVSAATRPNVSPLFYKQEEKVSVVYVKFAQNLSVNLGFLVISNTADANVALFYPLIASWEPDTHPIELNLGLNLVMGINI